jgi:hypothetical protein
MHTAMEIKIIKDCIQQWKSKLLKIAYSNGNQNYKRLHKAMEIKIIKEYVQPWKL